MYSKNEDEVELIKLKGRAYKLLASEETIGCKNLCAGITLFPAGKHAPGHIHESQEEVIYCLEGSGEAVIDGKSMKIKPGTVVYFPPGSLHSINNTGKETIKLLFMFSPSTKIGAYKNYESK
ncbi:MAG: cupin domain-containing protein [Actinobacteria bacterium]|nr:cupin domain-containing protein [Actinomycetota bacterium]